MQKKSYKKYDLPGSINKITSITQTTVEKFRSTVQNPHCVLYQYSR